MKPKKNRVGSHTQGVLILLGGSGAAINLAEDVIQRQAVYEKVGRSFATMEKMLTAGKRRAAKECRSDGLVKRALTR